MEAARASRMENGKIKMKNDKAKGKMLVHRAFDFILWFGIIVLITNRKDYLMRFRPYDGVFSF